MTKKITVFIFTALIAYSSYGQMAQEHYQNWLSQSGIGQVLKLREIRQFTCCQVLLLDFVEDDLDKQFIGWKKLKELYPNHELAEKLFLQGVSLWRIDPDNFGISISGGAEVLQISADFSNNRIRVYGDTVDLNHLQTKSHTINYPLDLDRLLSTKQQDIKAEKQWTRSVLYKEAFSITKKYFRDNYGVEVTPLSPYRSDSLKIYVNNMRGGAFSEADAPTLCRLWRWAFGETTSDCRPHERYTITISYAKAAQRIRIEVDGSVAADVPTPSSPNAYRTMDKTGYGYQLKLFSQAFSTHLYNQLTK